ncbi:TIGR03086 family metal-binding protein [Streptomyces sp. NPDC051219]|uniref:TIGR03086 family metal-binding protein n=1 Tax=Streptomyces sp. NPDC051219 TaxID=3155283 RepID=UPI003439A06A
MSEIADRYRRHADAFERRIAATRREQWGNPSPCEDWTARDLVGHIIDMHGVMLRPVDRFMSPAPSLRDDPLGAFRAARADVEAILDDAALAGRECRTPNGPMTVERHIDEVVSNDMVFHGWDLARATGQDDTIDTVDVERLWASTAAVPKEVMDMMRTPDAFGPGVKVFGPEVEVPENARLQDRLLGMTGRDPR